MKNRIEIKTTPTTQIARPSLSPWALNVKRLKPEELAATRAMTDEERTATAHAYNESVWSKQTRTRKLDLPADAWDFLDREAVAHRDGRLDLALRDIISEVKVYRSLFDKMASETSVLTRMRTLRGLSPAGIIQQATRP